jgi:hypothetical protein
MQLHNPQIASKARIALFWALAALIPFLLVGFKMLETTGEIHPYKFWVFPTIIFISLCMYVLYKRRKDAENQLPSKRFYILVEAIIASITLIGSITVSYFKFTSHFDLRVFIVVTLFSVFGIQVLLTAYADFKKIPNP